MNTKKLRGYQVKFRSKATLTGTSMAKDQAYAFVHISTPIYFPAFQQTIMFTQIVRLAAPCPGMDIASKADFAADESVIEFMTKRGRIDATGILTFDEAFNAYQQTGGLQERASFIRSFGRIFPHHIQDGKIIGLML